MLGIPLFQKPLSTVTLTNHPDIGKKLKVHDVNNYEDGKEHKGYYKCSRRLKSLFMITHDNLLLM